MTSWTLPNFEHPGAAWALLAVPCLVFFWWRVRRSRLNQQQEWGYHSVLLSPRRLGKWLLLMSVLALCIALLGPEVGQESITPTGSARDLLFIVDVSQSMLAEDKAAVSRLERAKQSMLELLQWLEQRPGRTRVGLVLFAGQSRLQCPPTDDLEHVSHLVRELNTESLGERGRTAELQGTAFGTSFSQLRAVLQEWGRANSQSLEYTQGLILSDGDELLPTAMETVIPFRLSAYAIGDASRDWPIPLGNGYLQWTNPATSVSERALTRRQEDRLQQFIEPTGGKVMVEDTASLPLIRWFQNEFEGQPVRPLESQKRTLPINRAAWLLSLASLLLWMELALGGARQRTW